MSFLSRIRVRKNSTGDGFTRRRVNLIEGTNVTLTVADDSANDEVDVTIDAAGAGGAPTTADYLVGTADAGLSNEIVVGTAPGGELGGTWAAPTVDAVHSGTSHAGVVTTHEAAAAPHAAHVCKIYHSTTQILTTGVSTALTFDSEELDTDGFHEGVTNPTRITIPTGLGGKYSFGCKVTMAASSLGVRVLRFQKNGATTLPASRWADSSPPTTEMEIEYTLGPIALVAGDYVEILAFHNVGAGLAYGSATTEKKNGFWCTFHGS